MTGNNNDVASKVYNQSKILARNLRTKGIKNINANQGLNYLISKVLDINQYSNPTLTGVNFTTSLTCNTTVNAIVGDTIIITGVLSCFRDDISDENIDLNNGRLSNAIVEVYDGGDLLGTCITNINGEYSFNYTVTETKDMSIMTVFTGNNDYTNCNSNSVNVSVFPYADFNVTLSKNILSYSDNDYSDITVQLVDNDGENVNLNGVPISFGVDDYVWDTLTTDNNGTVTYRYMSQGIGDIDIKVSNGTFLTKTFSIRDAIRCNPNDYVTGNTAQTVSMGYNLPSAFRVLFKIKATASDYCSSYIFIGQNTTNAIVVGHTSSLNGCNILIRNNGSYVKQSEYISVSTNTEYEIEYTYDNGSHTLKVGNTTKTLSDTSITPSQIIEASIRNNQCKELTILPL